MTATRDPNADTAEDILLVDADPGVREGLGRLLEEAGFVVTAVAAHDRARDQLVNRFQSVLVVELDGPGPKAGLDLVRFCRERSPLTSIIVLSPRRTFEDVAAAFRAGALDVVPKTQDQIPYLIAKVEQAVRALRADRARERLLAEVAEVHDRFLSEMMTLARQVTELEEKISASFADGPGPRLAPLELLVVDDGPELGPFLMVALGADWVVRAAETSGRALDEASQAAPNVLVVKDELPDLPASMLVTALKSTLPDLVAVMFRGPRANAPGDVRLCEQSRVTTLIPEFTAPRQLVVALEEIKEALRRKARERRHLAAFRQQHADFLKLYGALKQRLTAKL